MPKYMIPVLALAVVLAAAPAQNQDQMMKKLTPVIVVEEVEPCLPFWLGLGFKQTMEVPHEDRIGFAAVALDRVEIMYQSRASAAADVPAFGEGDHSRASMALFIEIESLDRVLPALEGVEVVVPERLTSYGAREIWVRAPCGTLIGFAEMTEE